MRTRDGLPFHPKAISGTSVVFGRKARLTSISRSGSSFLSLRTPATNRSQVGPLVAGCRKAIS